MIVFNFVLNLQDPEDHLVRDDVQMGIENKEKSHSGNDVIMGNDNNVESQVPNNKSRISWGFLQHMYYLLLFGLIEIGLIWYIVGHGCISIKDPYISGSCIR